MSKKLQPGDPDYRPAYGNSNYRWEPFKPGNTVAMTHGARSARVIEPMAAEIANATIEVNPHLQEDRYREAVLEYARLVAKVERLEEWLDRNGQLDSDGKVRGASDYALKLRKTMSNQAERLGLTPLSAARLGKDTAAAKLDVTKILAAMTNKDGDHSDHSE